MRAKVISLVILAFSLPCIWFFAEHRPLEIQLPSNTVVGGVVALLIFVFPPAVGGVLAGWQWGRRGALAPFLYILSGVIYGIVLFLFPSLSGAPQDLWGFEMWFLVIFGTIGTFIAFFGVLAAIVIRWLVQRTRPANAVDSQIGSPNFISRFRNGSLMTCMRRLATRPFILSMILCGLWLVALSDSVANMDEVQPSTNKCQATVNGMYMLTQHLDLPKNLSAWSNQEATRLGNEFDVEQYFTVLQSISMEPGYSLDYVYSTALGNGFPTLYARPTDRARYRTYSEYSKAMSANGTAQAFFWSRLGDTLRDNTPVTFKMPDREYALLHEGYLSHVIAADDADGYFQLVLLYLLGDQFYLQWHANYSDTVVICDQTHLKVVLAKYVDWLDDHRAKDASKIIRGAEGMSLEPEVIQREDYAELHLTTFTKWGGLYRVTYAISREKPHVLVEMDRKNLVEYYCGVKF